MEEQYLNFMDQLNIMDGDEIIVNHGQHQSWINTLTFDIMPSIDKFSPEQQAHFLKRLLKLLNLVYPIIWNNDLINVKVIGSQLFIFEVMVDKSIIKGSKILTCAKDMSLLLKTFLKYPDYQISITTSRQPTIRNDDHWVVKISDSIQIGKALLNSIKKNTLILISRLFIASHMQITIKEFMGQSYSFKIENHQAYILKFKDESLLKMID